MNKLQISIREVENGYIVFSDRGSPMHMAEKTWVAVSIFQLKELVERLAAECLPEKNATERGTPEKGTP